MQQIIFYILPIDSLDDLEKSGLDQLRRVIECINNNSDIIQLAPNFLEPDANGKTIFDNRELNSTIMYLLQFLGKGKSVPDEINMSDYHNQFLALDNKKSISGKYVVQTENDLTLCYQNCAHLLLNFSELFQWKKKCFPKLLFTEDSFGNNQKAFSVSSSTTTYTTLYNQTVECLSVLNNNTDDLLQLEISKRIEHLRAKLPNISCSGKGSNEKSTFTKNICIVIKNKEGNKLINSHITCAPHFKLIRKDSDYRIYFSWGNKDTPQPAFIIAKIGKHWSSMDESLSHIYISLI